MKDIEYNLWPGTIAIANEKFMIQCSELYSNHYGVWDDRGIKPGDHIKLSISRLREWLDNDNVSIYYATINDELIGYAIAFSKDEHNYGIVTWVTQLVVHREYRNQGIAKNLLFSIWGLSNHFAWGIVSANPYAIRALEKATRRRAIPMRIKKNATKLRNIGRENVPYIYEDTEFKIDENSSMVNTKFYVEHANTVKMIANVTSSETPWNLGLVDAGWEWFAFTFKDQDQISLSKEEIEKMIDTSDTVVKKAYSRMNMRENQQTWMKNTKNEIDYIDTRVDLSTVNLVYDLGCGIGRHAIEIAERGIDVVGIDYVSKNVQDANENIERRRLSNIKIVEGDCREYENEKKADIVLCLYDVVGSFSKMEDNEKIIKTAFSLLKPGGFVFFSVMNYEMTRANAKNVFSLEKDANYLLKLSASNKMQQTGNVFDPQYYLVDEDTHLVYRKEQFYNQNDLPIELIVRDKRFTRDEIISMCEKNGFKVVESKYTNASGWENEYEGTSLRAKEILVVCQKKES